HLVADPFQRDLGELARQFCETSGKPDSLYEGVNLINFERWDEAEVARATALEAIASEDPDVTLRASWASLGARPEALESPELDARIDARMKSGEPSRNNDATTL